MSTGHTLARYKAEVETARARYGSLDPADSIPVRVGFLAALVEVAEVAREIEMNCGILYDRKFNTVKVERMERLGRALAGLNGLGT